MIKEIFAKSVINKTSFAIAADSDHCRLGQKSLSHTWYENTGLLVAMTVFFGYDMSYGTASFHFNYLTETHHTLIVRDLLDTEKLNRIFLAGGGNIDSKKRRI